MNDSKHKLFLTSEKREFQVESGQTVLEALIDAGVFLRTDCGGKGGCGKCRVKVLGAPAEAAAAPDESEIKILGQKHFSAGYRLACRMSVSGDIALEIPETSRLSAEVAQKGLTTLFTHLSDLKLSRTGKPGVYGLAVDLGTTTIAVYLCDLGAGSVLASTSARNPQALFGDDVMSRIGVIRSNPGLLQRQQKMAARAVEWGTTSLCRSTGVDPLRIESMAVVGNTTMIHIFVGEDPSSIGVFPYEPAFVRPRTLRAGSLGFHFNPNTRIHTLPMITGFIGADIVAAAMASNLARCETGTMLVDVGTNGEIMYVGADGLVATSCATGPAFEGAAIQHGMHAVSGAIDAVRIDKAHGRAVCSVIQQDPHSPKKVAGICGTGVISAAAELLRAGVISSDGAFSRGTGSPYLQRDENDAPEFVLVPGKDTQDGRPVTFTQKDVRAVQLAKGALRAGIDLLCREAGRQRPLKLQVAGAFGSFINKKDALTIGMFPQIPESDIEVVGNAAGAGAILAVFDEKFAGQADELTRVTRVLELSVHPEFQNTFIESLSFPELLED